MSTSTALKVTYACPDGTPFPVSWPSEESAQYRWRWNEAHYPEPLKPLVAQMHLRGHAAGQRMWSERDLIPPPMFRDEVVPFGFQYLCGPGVTAEEQEEFDRRSLAWSAQFGSLSDALKEHAVPRIRAMCERLQQHPGLSIQEIADTKAMGLQLTHIAGIGTLGPYNNRLTALLRKVFGPEAEMVFFDVTQGAENDTLAADARAWEVAQVFRADSAMAAALSKSVEAAMLEIRSRPATDAARAAFDGYVEQYRYRAESWDIAAPTLGERPEMALRMISQAMIRSTTPAEVQAASAARRGNAIARVEAALAGDGWLLAEFRDLVERLSCYVAVREGRALWQLTAAGSARTAVLRRGRALVAEGRIEKAEDVFFLLADEIDGASSADKRATVRVRKNDWRFWRAHRPPAFIGGGEEAAAAARDDNVVRGIGGSRGKQTGVARVILELSAADTLQDGEVLVCVTTSPPWTPLFAVASAIVTSSGMPLSHAAIAAREYGIPAVVGAASAMERIRTGDVITVDGDAGTVTIERSG